MVGFGAFLGGAAGGASDAYRQMLNDEMKRKLEQQTFDTNQRQASMQDALLQAQAQEMKARAAYYAMGGRLGANSGGVNGGAYQLLGQMINGGQPVMQPPQMPGQGQSMPGQAMQGPPMQPQGQLQQPQAPMQPQQPMQAPSVNPMQGQDQGGVPTMVPQQMGGGQPAQQYQIPQATQHPQDPYQAYQNELNAFEQAAAQWRQEGRPLQNIARARKIFYGEAHQKYYDAMKDQAHKEAQSRFDQTFQQRGQHQQATEQASERNSQWSSRRAAMDTEIQVIRQSMDMNDQQKAAAIGAIQQKYGFDPATGFTNPTVKGGSSGQKDSSNQDQIARKLSSGDLDELRSLRGQYQNLGKFKPGFSQNVQLRSGTTVQLWVDGDGAVHVDEAK